MKRTRVQRIRVELSVLNYRLVEKVLAEKLDKMAEDGREVLSVQEILAGVDESGEYKKYFWFFLVTYREP